MPVKKSNKVLLPDPDLPVIAIDSFGYLKIKIFN